MAARLFKRSEQASKAEKGRCIGVGHFGEVCSLGDTEVRLKNSHGNQRSEGSMWFRNKPFPSSGEPYSSHQVISFYIQDL